MAQRRPWEVEDSLWELIEPLLPTPERRFRHPGRRRLRDWHQAGVWQRLHEVLLARLQAAGVIDWSRAAADGSHVRALKGGPRPGPARSTGPGLGPSTT